MKNILITGSGSGFGKLLAETLLEKGYTVFATMLGLETMGAQGAKNSVSLPKINRASCIYLNWM